MQCTKLFPAKHAHLSNVGAANIDGIAGLDEAVKGQQDLIAGGSTDELGNIALVHGPIQLEPEHHNGSLIGGDHNQAGPHSDVGWACNASLA